MAKIVVDARQRRQRMPVIQTIPQRHAEAVAWSPHDLVFHIVPCLMCDRIHVSLVDAELQGSHPHLAASIHHSGCNHVAAVGERIPVGRHLGTSFQHLRLEEETGLRRKVRDEDPRKLLQLLQLPGALPASRRQPREARPAGTRVGALAARPPKHVNASQNALRRGVIQRRARVQRHHVASRLVGVRISQRPRTRSFCSGMPFSNCEVSQRMHGSWSSWTVGGRFSAV
mmetsp:Transcript_19707/g.61945  ORF Transcript_19707/g.61945 Transcript_19707/m.61945 type:complete len:228 (+) Transcript_19707:60-743(+)